MTGFWSGGAECTKTTSSNVLIVCEIGGNHSRSREKVKQMIVAAKEAGADAVKVQAYLPSQMTLNSDAPEFRITEGLWAGHTLYDLYRKAYMPHEWIPEQMDLTHSLGMEFIASVFHPDMVPVMEDYGVPIYKVSSFEISYADLRNSLARTGKPVVFSCGTATLTEIQSVVAQFNGKDRQMALLKCTSQYPAKPETMNLATIPDMIRRFDCPIGLSDHSLGIAAPVVAVSLGAAIIETHFKIDADGFDVAFSLDPKQFREMVDAVRDAEKCMGTVDYTPSATQFKRKEVNGKWIRTVK